MLDARQSAPEPSLVESVLRVVEAGHRLVLDRIDLARFDLGQLAARTLRGTVLIAAGAFLLSGAWFALMAGAIVWLHQFLSLAVSLVIVAVITAALGAGAIATGLQRGLRPTPDSDGPAERVASVSPVPRLAEGTDGG
jgi:hypothetical protein